ncbi:MAG: hypothetical protein LBU79_01095 [Planctomycetota bacterium]|nr:hypothetical protein [Planctomycetota bacterium]
MQVPSSFLGVIIFILMLILFIVWGGDIYYHQLAIPQLQEDLSQIQAERDALAVDFSQGITRVVGVNALYPQVPAWSVFLQEIKDRLNAMRRESGERNINFWLEGVSFLPDRVILSGRLNGERDESLTVADELVAELADSPFLSSPTLTTFGPVSGERENNWSFTLEAERIRHPQ